ncbi:MAG TPA: hypothetical protein VJU61_21515, partial [Polyangiaceae bacterium]|nr:hypothetical protein [Polyangiaceae bacterium]
MSRGFLGLTLGVSLVNLGLFVRAGQLFEWHLDESWYPTTSFFIALSVGVVALLLYHVHRPRSDSPARKSMPRWFVPAALLFALIHTSAILLSMVFPDMPEGMMTTATLIGRHWTIPWSVLIAVSLAQAHCADVILKRSLWLLVSVSLATACSLWVFDVAPGMPLLVTTLVTAALMLATPALIRALDTLVDQTFLDRPHYAQASEALEQSFRRASTSEQLVDAALESVRTTLRVDARWVENRIETTTSHQARTLMQQELTFLESVRTELAHRLEAMRFEQDQRALHVREERLKRL